MSANVAAWHVSEICGEVICMAIGTNMIKVSCSFCGRKPDNERLDSDFWPLYARCIDSYSNVCICNACKIRHPNAYDFYFSEKEEGPMKVKVRRDSKEEIEVDVNDLQYNDEFDISKYGEVIATGTIVDTWVDKYGVQRADVTVTFKKEGKTWRDLGYDCFDDMIDDIAKEHGSLRHKDERYKCCGCLNTADSYGESYVEIEQNGEKTIVHSDSVTIYPVHKEDD